MHPEFHITFLHANGYPSGVYRQFFDALSVHATIDAPEILESAPDCPPVKRWPQMLEPVSYTHLDVYKRQGQDTAPGEDAGHDIAHPVPLRDGKGQHVLALGQPVFP